MKTHGSFIISMGAIALIATSCSDKVYHYTPQDYFNERNYTSETPFSMQAGNVFAPLPYAKKEFSLSATTWSGGRDMRISYSPLGKLVLMADHSSLKYISTELKSIDVPVTTYNGFYDSTLSIENIPFSKEHSWEQSNNEVAAGYFNTAGKMFRFDLLAGMGMGKVGNYYTYLVDGMNETIYMNEWRTYNKFFLQGDLGFTKGIFDASVSSRFSYLDFNSRTLHHQYSYQNSDMAPMNLLFEPSFHVGVGVKVFRLFCEYGMAVPLNNTDVNWNSAGIRMGAIIRINAAQLKELKRKKTKA